MIVNCHGWEDYYLVSDKGDVYSKPRKGINGRVYGGSKLTPIVRANGYIVVNLTGNGRREQELVHRLVLLSFIGVPDEGMQACHGNGIRNDCRLANLRWGTVKENHQDRMRHGLTLRNEDNGYCRFLNEDILKIRASNKSTSEICEEFGISRTHYYRVIKGEVRLL